MPGLVHLRQSRARGMQNPHTSVSGCSRRCFRCSRLHVNVKAELLVVELLESGRTNVGSGCPAQLTPLLRPAERTPCRVPIVIP
jgi:hypothetical protein